MVEVPLVALNSHGHASWATSTQLRGMIRTNDEVIARCESQVMRQGGLLVDIFSMRRSSDHENNFFEMTSRHLHPSMSRIRERLMLKVIKKTGALVAVRLMVGCSKNDVGCAEHHINQEKNGFHH